MSSKVSYFELNYKKWCILVNYNKNYLNYGNIEQIHNILCTILSIIERNFSRETAHFTQIEFDVTLCDDQTMRDLNKQHRQIDKTTDVLSFPVHEWWC